jgi:hypothetical protein
MDGLREFLEACRRQPQVQGHFLGLLHVAIGRRIVRKADQQVISTGVTWRQLAELLRQVRWDKEAVRELGLSPDSLPPRDRQKYWYQAIAACKLDSPEAIAAGDKLAAIAATFGYEVGPAPGQSPPSTPSTTTPPAPSP